MRAENKQLTGVRGIAALYVVFYHCFHLVYDVQFIKNGYLSVDLFFILSGFVMALSYAERFIKFFTVRNYFAFLQNRIARIWPAYFFWLICNSIYLMYKDRFVPGDFLYNLFMIQNLGLSSSIIGTGWSISIEFFSYFLFPFVVLIFFKNNRLIQFFLLLIIFILLMCISKSNKGISGPLDITSYLEYFTIIRGVGEFVLGMGLFFIITRAKKIINSIFPFSLCTDIVFVLIVLSLSLKGTDVVSVFLFFLLIGGLYLSNNSIVSKIFSSKIFHFLGAISYSLYLCHIPLIYFMMDRLGRYFNKGESFLLSIFVLIIISYCSLIFIEKPMRKLLVSRKI
ncbi:acyltransferase family protein [Klebsiella electrica]